MESASACASSPSHDLELWNQDELAEGENPLTAQECPLPESAHRHVCRLLFTSHFLSTWNSRVFEFGAFLFLARIFPQTLLPASVYALVRAASAAVLAPWIGTYIDRTDRLTAVRLSIGKRCFDFMHGRTLTTTAVGQRLPVIASCLVFLAISKLDQDKSSTLRTVTALAALSLLACIEKLSWIGNTISIERDWAVTISTGSEKRLECNHQPSHGLVIW